MINYKVIDLDSYPHKAHLDYFLTMVNPVASATVEIDVTDLKNFCKSEGVSFFLSFLHVVALASDDIPQFRQRIHKLNDIGDYEIREYEQCPTSHTESQEGDLYGYCTVYHHMPWKEYILKATKVQEEARKNTTLEEDDDIEACSYVTCVPWIHYSCINLPWGDVYDSNIRFSWGKYVSDDKGKIKMPLSVSFNHGLIDGRQAGLFYENVEKYMKKIINGEL